MIKQLVLILTVLFSACAGPRIDPGARNEKAVCDFLLEETQRVSSEVLHVEPPIEIKTSAYCMCGVLHWGLVDSAGTELQVCLERKSLLLRSPGHRRQFGFDGCHGGPESPLVALQSAEEDAIVGAFSLWLIDNFSGDELVATQTQPADCLLRDYFDAAANAAILLNTFESEPERFELAFEIIRCGA